VTLGSAVLRLDGPSSAVYRSVRLNGEPRNFLCAPFDFMVEGEIRTCTLRHQVATNDADTYMALAQQGMGIAQLPRSRAVRNLLDSRDLVPILESWCPTSFPVFLAYPRNRHLSARVRVFADWVVELYAGILADLSTWEQV
jgi:DNA-binding transcriptional LysR family regulator